MAFADCGENTKVHTIPDIKLIIGGSNYSRFLDILNEELVLLSNNKRKFLNERRKISKIIEF
jgi:hypothetical protein